VEKTGVLYSFPSILINANILEFLSFFRLKIFILFVSMGWEKTLGNGKNWLLPEKMGKTRKLSFFKIHV
jgi:hypothetical protein